MEFSTVYLITGSEKHLFFWSRKKTPRKTPKTAKETMDHWINKVLHGQGFICWSRLLEKTPQKTARQENNESLNKLAKGSPLRHKWPGSKYFRPMTWRPISLEKVLDDGDEEDNSQKLEATLSGDRGIIWKIWRTKLRTDHPEKVHLMWSLGVKNNWMAFYQSITQIYFSKATFPTGLRLEWTSTGLDSPSFPTWI